MTFLSVQNISKSFEKQEIPAVHDVSFELAQGKIMALIGSSGSGKSTLMKIIAGLLDADEGQVLLEEKPVLGPSQQLVAGHERIRLLAQGFDLAPKMKVYENLKFFLLKWPKPRQQQRIEELLKICGLEGMANRYPRELSGGQQQRLALGRALADYPDLLLLDEPFSHLDSHLRHQMRDTLASLLNDTQTTALMVTHDPQDALYMADIATIIRQGRLVQTGSPEHLYKHPTTTYVAQLFGRPNIIATDTLTAWPNSPQYPAQRYCCLHEWDISPAVAGLPATVGKITFLGGYFEVLLSVYGHPLRMKTLKHEFQLGQTIHIHITWDKVQLLADTL